MVGKLRKEREKKDNLDKRQEKLRRLLDEEGKSHEIELMVKNRHKYVSPRPSQADNIPTEVHQFVYLKLHDSVINGIHFRFSKKAN